MRTERKKTRRLAFAAILSAFGVILLYCGSFLDVLDLTAAALASLLCVVAVIELGKGYAFLIYAVISCLSLLLLPQKSPAAIFLLFAGWYPIVKSVLERLPRVLSWILKFVAFNAGLTLMILATVFLFHFPDSAFSFSFSVYLLGNPAFLLYDIALSRLLTAYIRIYRKRLRIKRQ